ncbi:MFS transporter [Pseudonocardia sp. RS11V-5]|uniref:MFS transporter n=1 Tax=Pseudonocardia terrae TaxID=2905831 RepID=UPI001E3AAD04|nr:MFS transporter [Pseudonocardia terrae]MCE3556211.1 MFS transporter [Pseudonocardia terrae]
MIYLLGAVTFLMGTTELVVAGLLPDISASLAITPSQAGLLITVFAVGMLVGAPVMALATLRLPRRLTLVLALIVFALGHLVVAVSTSFAVVLMARFAAALATGTFWAVGAVVAAAAAGQAASARAMGVMIGGVTLANIIGVPLGTLGGQLMGWRGPFWVLAVLATAATVVIARRLPGDSGGAETTLGAEVAALRQGRIWVVYLATALVQGSVFAAYSYVAPLLIDRAGLPAVVVPLVMLGYGAGALAGTTLGGRRGDRRPYSTMIPATAAIVLVLAALALWSTSSIAAVALIVLLGLFGLMSNPVLVAQVVTLAGPAHTLAVSLSTSSFNVGIAAGSWLGGLALATSLGAQGPALAGLTLAGAGLLPLIGLALTRRRARRGHTT